MDGFLLSGILLLMLTGLFTLYSATDANLNRVTNQATNMLVALGIMWLVANIPLTAYHAHCLAYLCNRAPFCCWA